jgi:hypothetical protein
MTSPFASTAARGTSAGTGHSSAPDAATAGGDAVRAALAGRAAQATDLVVIFPKAGYDLDALLAAAVAAAAPAPVVGATTVGAFTAEAQVPDGCVALVLRGGSTTRFGICHVERADDEDIAAMTRDAADLARARAGEERASSVLMLLCDGLTPDQRAVARGAYEATSALVPLVGGAAGDDLHWRETFTLGEGRVSGRGLVAVWITSDRPLAVSVDHGWRTFSRPMLVTRCDGAVIRELDGQPALEMYLSERGAALKEDARSFGEKCMERPIGIPNSTGGYDLRQIHQATDDGGIVLTTAIAEQTVVQVMTGDPDGLLEGARRAAATALRDLDGPATFALVFSCCTRAPVLGARLGEEITAITEVLGGVPAAGFFTCGEFARVPGSTGIHNSSVALLCL